MSTKKQLHAHCVQLGINVPEAATKKQLAALIYDYFMKAAYIRSDEGLIQFRQTEKPTSDFIAEFQLAGYVKIKAENEEVAREWLEEALGEYDTPGKYNDGELTEWEIIGIEVDNEGN